MLVSRSGYGVGVLLSSLALFAACGSAFDSACEENRSCPVGNGAAAGDDADEPGGGGSAAGGSGNVAGSGGKAGGGAGGTSEPPEGAAPRVISVSPENAAEGAEPEGTITLQFSEELDEATVTKDSIRVLDGNNELEGTLAYADGKVTFTPARRLALLAEYEVEVTTDVTDLEGVALQEGFASTFTVRDGAWHAVDVVKGDLFQLSSALPMTESGSVLVSWSGGGGNDCPTSAAWFEPSAKNGTTKSFTDVGGSSCAALEVASNGGAAGAVSWAGDSTYYVQQYRAGAWLAQSYPAPNLASASVGSLSVGPNGVVTRFQYPSTTGLTAFRTNEAGTWEASGDVLSTTLSTLSAPNVSFDAQGDGVAVWRAMDSSTNRVRIAMSRFNATTGKWSAAEDVPGSVGTTEESFDSRGVPAVLLAPNGEGVIVWRKGSGTSTLMANYYAPQTGWGAAEIVSAGTSLSLVADEPGVAFDGSSFVVAWVGADASATQMFTSVYGGQSGWNAGVGHDAELPLPFSEMPRIVSDGRGSLLLVWKTGAAPAYALVYQRLIAGEWGDIQLIPGGSITDSQTQGAQKAPVAMNASGVAAISWANRGEASRITGIRLASFY